MPTTKKKTALEKFQEAARELTLEERQALMDSGVSLPIYTGTSDERKWGYRCRHCNEVALDFVGDQFLGLDGQVYDMPPASTPVHHFPFVQPQLQSNNPKHRNRQSPVCQHCLHPIDLQRGNLKNKRIVLIKEWLESRDKGYALARQKKGLFQGTPANVDLQDVVPDTWVDPGERSEISAIADEHNLGQAVFGKGPQA